MPFFFSHQKKFQAQVESFVHLALPILKLPLS